LLSHLIAGASIDGMETAELSGVLSALRARGMRVTPQRRAIVAEVIGAQGHISPAAVARRVQEIMPGVNASTVYRTLATLEEAGILAHAHLEAGAEYHRAGEAGHIHLVCSRCGADDELSLEEARHVDRLIREHRGFQPDLAHFAISGLCARCQKEVARSGARRPSS
jgi:Fur family transcriptional regulator, ferric uptake regulator